jgi:hypothetical protein
MLKFGKIKKQGTFPLKELSTLLDGKKPFLYYTRHASIIVAKNSSEMVQG